MDVEKEPIDQRIPEIFIDSYDTGDLLEESKQKIKLKL